MHGNWSPWGKWTTCSASCGQGITHRRRTCTNPRPSFNGNYCFDDPNEYSLCIVRKCPGTLSSCSYTADTVSPSLHDKINVLIPFIFTFMEIGAPGVNGADVLIAVSCGKGLTERKRCTKSQPSSIIALVTQHNILFAKSLA